MSKILIIPSWYPTPERPGHGIFVKRHVLEIARLNEVTVLYFDFLGGSRAKIDVKISRINDLYDEIIVTLPPQTGIVSVLRNFLLVSKYYLKFGRKKESGYFNVIHLHVPYHIGIFLWPWLILSRSKLIITEHWSGYFDEDGRYNRLSSLTKYLLRRLFLKANKITAVSKALAMAINKKLVPEKKIEIVPNVINCNIKPRPILPEFNTLKKFLFLGNLNNAEKNISGIIESFAAVAQSRNDLQLIIAGSGQDEMMLKTLAKEKGLDDSKIQFRGFVSPDKLSGLYSECICMILNSHFETFSIAAAESILYGVPVISTRCYGPEEFIDETNGVFIDKGDLRKLSESILLMANGYNSYDGWDMNFKLNIKYCIDFSIRFSKIINEK